MNDQHIIEATGRWLTDFVIAYEICPFARREHLSNSIRYQVCRTPLPEQTLAAVVEECEHLDKNPETETTLLILPEGYEDFDDYLDILAIAEQLLIELGYEGIYQIASFHPDYHFEFSEPSSEDDAANYTNRSPFPMLHLLRESSIERAIATFPDPENIPTRNIQKTRQLGAETLSALLAQCRRTAG